MESLSLIILEAAVCMQVLHLLTRWTLSWEVTVGLQLVWTLEVDIRTSKTKWTQQGHGNMSVCRNRQQMMKHWRVM